MTYPNEYYTQILNEITKAYGLDVAGIDKRNWIIWRRSIKNLFEKDYLISEIISALRSAGEKRKWPYDTSLFARIKDSIDVARKEKASVKVTEGFTKIDLTRYGSITQKQN